MKKVAVFMLALSMFVFAGCTSNTNISEVDSKAAYTPNQEDSGLFETEYQVSEKSKEILTDVSETENMIEYFVEKTTYNTFDSEDTTPQTSKEGTSKNTENSTTRINTTVINPKIGAVTKDADSTKKTTEKAVDESKTVDSGTRKYSKEKNGLLLEVFAPKTIKKGEKFVCEAKITNNTDKNIYYSHETYTKESLNDRKLSVKIKSGKYEFLDCDKYDTLELNMSAIDVLKPGESYMQKISFIPGICKSYYYDVSLENAEIEYFEPGICHGTAEFKWSSSGGYNNDQNISLNFDVEIK